MESSSHGYEWILEWWHRLSLPWLFLKQNQHRLLFMTLGSGKATARPMISLQWLYFIFFAGCGKEGSRCKLVAPLHQSLCYDFRPQASRPFSHSKKSKWSDFSPRFFTYAEPMWKWWPGVACKQWGYLPPQIANRNTQKTAWWLFKET